MDPLLSRFLERFTVVLFGGMAIYLGFRLFLEVPEHRDSSGKVAMPWDISVVMTRIGPGVFFALFGVAAISLTLIRPLEVSLEGSRGSEDQGRHLSVRYIGEQALGEQVARADARALLRKEIARLNAIPRLLRPDLPEHDRDPIRRSIARVKLLLMKPVWGDSNDGFGDIGEFERWVEAGEPDPPPARMEGALALYRYGTKGPTP
jgi:hypothetical protein